LYVSLNDEKTSNVTKWLIVSRHFTQVILPYVGLQGSSGKRFAGHGNDAAFLIPSRVTGGGYKKADLRTLLPETSGKFMSEKEGVVAPALGKQLDRIVKTAPGWVNCNLKPSAEREPIRACLANDDAKKFLPGHSVFSLPQIP
jgi:hypothetical protein